jgi:hypothetical protein
MAIKLDIITEKLENISEGCYATDLVGDVVNWILNKPRPYRVLYDSKYDVWVICNALENTHRGMAEDLFDSGYLYDVSRTVDNDIQDIRDLNPRKYHTGWTDAEVYTEEGFNNYQLKGFFFIPDGKHYEDYENSSFYSVENPIEGGIIFTQLHDEFSPSGIFKDMYNRMKRMNVIKDKKPSLMDIYRKCKSKYGSDWLDHYYNISSELGYDDDEVQDFVDEFAIIDFMKG